MDNTKSISMLVAVLLVFLEVDVSAVTSTTTVTSHAWCYEDHPILDGLICYKACATGYKHKGGGPVCWAICPPRTTDIGALCTKHSYGRGVGKPLSTCSKSQEKSGLLCYPKCKPGYYGVGPVCWSKCKSGYTDDGALCRKNAHIYGRDVKSCPWYDKCGLCGGPWYNVCGRRRKCGGKCKSGYHNDGCTCRRDVHITAKSTYGRGVGAAMKCKPDEEKNWALCYPPCKSGYTGVGPVCWAQCSGKTVDTGTQCQKKSYGRGVGKAISCLKVPVLSDLTNYKNLVDIFKKADSIQKVQAMGCSVFYNQVQFWIRLIQSFNNCNKKGNWKTVSLAFSAGASAGVSASGELGVAVDMQSNKGLCYVGYCYGVKTDVAIGAEISIGWWRRLDDIPGPGIEYTLGVDIPLTELGFSAVFVTELDGTYVGTMFEFGIGIGLLPFELGFHRCETPANATIPFTI